MSELLRPARPSTASSPHSVLTLVLCTILHGFTHAYGTLLVPLYLLIAADLSLGGVKAASLLVTVYGLVYCLASYAAGVIADRTNRKLLLGVGLVANALAILFMGLTRRYEVLLALSVVAGLAGTVFHPAANALAPAHFPKSPGMAIGLLGVGSGLGFFAGPQYAGWRAGVGGWHLGHIADWQRPCVELGIAGLIVGIIFLAFAREAPVFLSDRDRTGEKSRASTRLTPALSRGVAALGFVLGCRDFAGVAGLSLASIYLQKSHGLNARDAGFVLGEMMLLSVVVNPLAVYLTPGSRRLPALVLVLLIGAGIAAVVPFAPLRYTLLVLCGFQTCQLGSYALSDSAMLERVDPAVRGRVVGLFLVIAGTMASTGPWIMGWWTDRLGPRAADPLAYVPQFGLLALLMAVAAFATPLIARLGHADGSHGSAISPLSEVSPRTLEPIG